MIYGFLGSMKDFWWMMCDLFLWILKDFIKFHYNFWKACKKEILKKKFSKQDLKTLEILKFLQIFGL